MEEDSKPYPIFVARGIYVDEVDGVEYETPKKFTVTCPDCCSDYLMKHGFNKRKEQMFKCRKCGRTFSLHDEQEEYVLLVSMLILYMKGYTATKIAKKLGIHTSTVTKNSYKLLPIMKIMQERFESEML